MPDLIGKSLDKYHIMERLGAGGMAQVYKAAQIGLARYVAIKVIQSQHQTGSDETLTEIERFEREAIAVAGLSHPNIVPVYDFGRADNLYYMVMALIEGSTLKAQLENRRTESRLFALDEIVDIFKALASAIDYAHTHGVIHCDLKPANIMLTHDGQVVLTDFGIARHLKIPSHTIPGAIIGTPAYMSPEQVDGERGDTRSDIYALGVILYEMVTGRVPFAIDQIQDIFKHVNETVFPPTLVNPDTPQAVEQVILKALHKNPEERFQTAGALAQALAVSVEPDSGYAGPDESQSQPGVQPPLAEPVGPHQQPKLEPPKTIRQDWGEAPDVSLFCGRQKELAQLEQWIIADKCRLVGLLGLGGIGKTALATRLAEQIEDEFEIIIWRSLRNVPLLDDILDECLQVLFKQTADDVPDSLNQKIARLIDQLRKHRCLLIFDNIESLLREGNRAGYYQPGYENYGELFKQVGELRHQSCLLLTSREKPKEFALLEGEETPVRSLRLKGLPQPDGQTLLKDKRLFGAEEVWTALINRYSGNPLALKLVSETIREVFDGHIADFLNQDASIFGGIRDLLSQQFERLSPLEQAIITWLAIEREAISREDLRANLVHPISTPEFVEALQSLRRRSLVEKRETNFTLQNVVMEYTTEQLIAQVCREITTRSISKLQTHALLKAQAKDYVRDTQSRLILKPIVQKLRATLSPQEIENQLKQILNTLRQTPSLQPDYAAGNILNLLIQLQSDLSQFDFSHLTVRQAYLSNVELHDANFARAALSDAVFTETFGRILSLAFSPNGKLLAAGTATGEVHLWNATTGQLLLTCEGHTNWVRSVAFSPDGQLLASGSTDQTVRLWEVSTGRCLRILSGRWGRIWSVAFSADGWLLAGGGDDRQVHLWDISQSSAQPIKTFSDHTNWIKSVAFSPDGRLLASGSDDQSVRIWDVQTGQCCQILSGHTGWVWSVAFSPDGRYLVSGSADQTVRLWEVESGQCLHTLSGHTDQIYSVAFSPEGQFVASGSKDRTVRFWDTQAGQGLYNLRGHTAWISTVAFSPNGRILVSGSFNQTVRQWEVNTGRCLHHWQGYANWVSSVAFDPAGQTLASGGDDRIVRIWEAKPGGNRCLHAMSGHTNWLTAVAFSPNSHILASGSADRTVRLWNVRQGTKHQPHILQGHAGWVWSVAFGPDGRLLASGSEDHTVMLWHVETGESLHTFEGHADRVRSVAFSPNGEVLASGSDDQAIRLWKIDNRQNLHILQGHTDWVLSVAFSPDGRHLASGSADRTIRLWNVETAQCIKILKGHTDRVRSVAFGPAGDILASGSEDKTITLWEISSGQPLQTLAGHADIIKSVAFSADGNLLATASDDGTIKLWEVQSGTCLETLRGDRPYERMNIAGVSGLTEAQETTLKTLGAIG